MKVLAAFLAGYFVRHAMVLRHTEGPKALLAIGVAGALMVLVLTGMWG